MSKRLRYAGFAEEATFAQATPPAAKFHVDIASASLDAPADTEMLFEGSLGRGARQHRPGRYGPATGNVVYAFDIDTIAHFLKWALGNYVFTVDTPAPGTNTHEFYPSVEDGFAQLTAEISAAKDAKGTIKEGSEGAPVTLATSAAADDIIDTSAAHGYAAGDVVVFTALTGGAGLTTNREYYVIAANLAAQTFKVSETAGGAAVNFTTDITAGTVVKTGMILSAAYPLAFHEVTASLGGVDESAKVKSLTLTINNNLENDGGFSIGSRYARRILAGQRNVGLAMNLWYEDTAELERFWGGTSGPSDNGSTEFAVALTFDAAADGQMVIDLPRVIYTQAQQQSSGRAEIVQAVQATAYEDDIALADASTVSTEILVTIESDEETL